MHLDSDKQIERVVDAIRATPEKTAEESRDLNEDESMNAEAVAIPDAGKPKAYEHAVAALLADTREWWEDVLPRDPEDFDEGETPFTPDAVGLRRFVERDLRPWYVQRRKELENPPLIRAQAFGQSLDPDNLSRLAEAPGGGDRAKTEEQPRAKQIAHAPEPTMRRGTPCRLPAVANGRCRMHGGRATGAPRRNSNAFKHGRYSTEALAERRAVSAVLRAARVLVDEVE